MNPASLQREGAGDCSKPQFTTTKGDFVVEVHRDWAPLGADRFYNLVKNGFFTNAAFFRVVPGFHGAVRLERQSGGEQGLGATPTSRTIR